MTQRVQFGFIRFDRWLAGITVPSFAEFKNAGFCFDNLTIDWLNISTEDKSLLELQRVRLENLQAFSFALPCSEALQAIRRLSPIVELGAGTGCWAKLLQNVGVDIIATDAKDQSRKGYVQRALSGHYFPVERALAIEAVTKYPTRNVLAVWPCLFEPWMYEAAEAMRPGTYLALVHEGIEGCIGDRGLFNCLEQDFTLEDEIAIPRWPGMQDRLGIWRRL